MPTFIRELQHAIRRLRNSPLFTIAATTTLAIAIGATASVFALVDGVLLKAFPYRSPDQVLTVWESNSQQHRPQVTVATANYFEWERQNHSFTALAATCCESLWFTVTGAEEGDRVNGLAVTANYFQVFGITPILGRVLASDTSGPNEVVISYGYWQRHFGGARSVVGRKITMDNANDARPTPRHTYTIVGVLPPGLPGDTDMWALLYFEPSEATNYDIRYLNVYGRLKPGVTEQSARADLATVAQRLAVAYPKTNEGWSVSTIPLLDTLVGPVRPALLVLLAAAACVLLIGAANLANLFLVRCLAREREMAVRTALGATRGRLVRELVAEASVLSLGAGALGVAVAFAGVRALGALAPPTLPRLSEIGVDGRVVAFCAFASLATVFIFGALPAWRASRGTLAEMLKEGGRGTGSAQHHRLQNGLAILQVAVALVLLTGAGLLVESFAHYMRIDPGFHPEGVLTARVTLSRVKYPGGPRNLQFFADLYDRLSAQPGVQAVGLSAWLSGFQGSFGEEPFTIVGDPPPDPSHTPTAASDAVARGYFRALGIKLLRGRTFLATDDSRSEKVAVIDELLARRFFAGRDPLGQRLIRFGRDTMRIVGIVSSVKSGLAVDAVPSFYAHMAQLRGIVATFVELRTSETPVTATRTLRQTVASLDPTVPISNIQTMSSIMIQSVGTTRFSSFLASLFALVALVLGVVGIYSVLAYIVAQRQREIAVRLALGARPSDVMRDVLRKAIGLAGTGIVLGSLTAWILTRTLAGLFSGVSPHDPVVFFTAPAIFAIVALVAASVPALRTTRVNPVVALTST